MVAGALATLMFVLFMEIGWRIPAAAYKLTDRLEGMTDLRAAAMQLSTDLRRTGSILEPLPDGGQVVESDHLVIVTPEGQVEWRTEAGVLIRTADGTERTWTGLAAAFKRNPSGLVEAWVTSASSASSLRVAVWVVEGS